MVLGSKVRHRFRMLPPLTFLLLALAFAPVASGAVTRELTFERDVRPILKAHCTHCHGEEEKPKGGVDLRLRRFMDKTLDDGGHVLVPGQPDESEMVLLIREGEMPKKGKKVSPEELAVIEQWIAQGAKDSEDRSRSRWRRACSSPMKIASSGRSSR